MSYVPLNEAERAWLVSFCQLRYGAEKQYVCLDTDTAGTGAPTLCQACFTFGSLRVLVAPMCCEGGRFGTLHDCQKQEGKPRRV